ncbi:peptidoglycan-binding domain-containing protein [Nonomuraea zeae]|uniref:Peptidoglycan-binding protein n=1 Tax=Nonomuraea zeae TaxID=1642303 RepID=A0A5S4GN83_9ACTN|nr:peptidoglycan-binding domain-containing protein [Nonomuraea zeae]TMR34377.1 peptidoglycan-binding protein [Nonomuraea zeae]
MKDLVRRVVVGTVGSATFAGLIVIGPPASAWVYCNTVSSVSDTSSGRIRYPTYNGDINCDMRLNTNGDARQREAISQLQETLNVCYSAIRYTIGNHVPPYAVTSVLSVDGEYGSKTREAVKSVQRYHNGLGASLVVDGYAGPKTRSTMLHQNVEQNFCSFRSQ